MACVGIDLGTTYSVVSIYKFPKVFAIYDGDSDTPLVPSVVSFQEDQQFVGKEAVARAGENPQNTIYEIKRFMGRKFEEEVVQENIQNLMYDVVKRDGKLKIKVNHLGRDEYLTPEEISAIILRKLKDIAQDYLKTEVTHAVITVPAYFQEVQRQATIDAGTIAGLTVRRIINEPTAAALAYGLDVKLKTEKKILVYDLGGGTFDVSILSLIENNITVLSTHGDTFLGGSNFVEEMIKLVTKGFSKSYKDLKKNPKAMLRIRDQCEIAKRQLSFHSSATMSMILLDNENDFDFQISRGEFEAINKHLFDKTLTLVDSALDRAKLGTSDIDDILLVGGSTHIPILKTLLMEKFKLRDIIVGVNRDEVVSRGAGIQASILHGTNVEDIKDLLLQDITPLTLGISVSDGVMSDVIPRCSRIPIKRCKMYTTGFDNQANVQIMVFEGERPIVKHNILLGEFTLTNIPPAPAGQPCIYVTFDIDENSILQVTAMEHAGGRKVTRTVASKKGNLSKEEVEYMLKSAQVFTRADTEKKDKLTARASVQREASAMMFRLREGDLRNKFKLQDKKRLQNEIKEHLQWLERNKNANVDEYKDLEIAIQNIELTGKSKSELVKGMIDDVD